MSDLAKISLLSYLTSEKQLSNLEKGKRVSVSSPEALALLVALSFHDRPRKMAYLFPTLYEAEAFEQFLGDYLGTESVHMFPYDEIFRASTIGVSPEMRNERLSSVASVFDPQPSILILHASSASLLLSPKERYRNALFPLKKGDEEHTVDEILQRLCRMGYQSVDRVTGPGQFARRGEIIDIDDAAYPDPVRLEMFGDEIEEIRVFKIADELSYRKVDSILVHPSSLRLLTPEEVESGKKEATEELKKRNGLSDRRAYDDLTERLSLLFSEASTGSLSDLEARFYPLFEKEPQTILDYLSDYETWTYHKEEVFAEREKVFHREEDYFRTSVKEGNSLPQERVYDSRKRDDFGQDIDADENNGLFLVRDPSYHSVSYAQSGQMIRQYLSEGYKVRIVLPEPNLTNYQNYLTEEGMAFSTYPLHSDVMFEEGRITHGFEIPQRKHVYLSAREIYGISDQRSRFLSRYKEAKVIRKYEDLKPGDYVVHEVHGVGKYLGVEQKEGLEYLKIQYAEDAIFYLPLSQYKLIRKYSSREGYTPTLDRLGGSTWSRKKARIRSRISFLADQLLAIYAKRATRPGFAFPSEPELESQFQKEFPYPYTASQRKCIEDVKEDMEAPRPMDRLIAGDVGFGKTEIAFNAAFKAILAHKQVAFLCPTTILCMQHYKTALARFDSFGVHVAALNRFVPEEEQKKVLQELKEGKVDLVIGTHRLLSDDVVFRDLGLLIVDEEQRFGVKHKEKIRQKTENVDCLTLTATPIPRTLQMSLLNIRSLSLLEDAPMNRMPVKTYVVKYDAGLIQEAIQKELDRKGQVYYLHNDIRSIYTLSEKLSKQFPEAKVGVCHAKMKENDIEETMDDFYEGKIDILVCTSIIESGLDIPNVNTIIVENADHFGLAQLYQIKGRVGRSDRLAYAYFLFKDEGRMTDDAHKRLKALKDFTELGSGYRIAMQDLNIRGAGDILGSEQAGFVDSLGYDAYLSLLQEVVKEKQVQNQAVVEEKRPDFELSFSLDAHIPEDYGTESQRINLYRELSDCSTEESLSAFGRKMTDIYGPYPEEVANLLVKKQIENLLNDGTYSNFVEGLGVYTLTLSEKASSVPGLYKDWDSEFNDLRNHLRIKIDGRSFVFVLTKTKDYLSELLYLTSQVRRDIDRKQKAGE